MSNEDSTKMRNDLSLSNLSAFTPNISPTVTFPLVFFGGVCGNVKA